MIQRRGGMVDERRHRWWIRQRRMFDDGRRYWIFLPYINILFTLAPLGELFHMYVLSILVYFALKGMHCHSAQNKLSANNVAWQN